MRRWGSMRRCGSMTTHRPPALRRPAKTYVTSERNRYRQSLPKRSLSGHPAGSSREATTDGLEAAGLDLMTELRPGRSHT